LRPVEEEVSARERERERERKVESVDKQISLVGSFASQPQTELA